MFKLWSETKPDAKSELKPDLGLRSWNDLKREEKIIIWQHLDWNFFDKDPKSRRDYSSESKYEFYGDYSEKPIKQDRIFKSVAMLNQLYKAQNYAPHFLEDIHLDTACDDFYNIFLNQSENVVMELLSLYCKVFLSERTDKKPYREEKETDTEFQKRTEEWKYEDFDFFCEKR